MTKTVQRNKKKLKLKYIETMQVYLNFKKKIMT